jgi:hypothetical protein
MSYRPNWWIPRTSLSVAELELALAKSRALLPRTKVSVHEKGPGRLMVAFEVADTLEPSCWAQLDLGPQERPPVFEAESFSDLAQALSVTDEDRELATQSFLWNRLSLAVDPASTRWMVGGEGPWLLEREVGVSPRFVRVLSQASFAERVERTRFEERDHGPGFLRVHLEERRVIACGAPNLLFVSEGDGHFNEVATGLPPNAELFDARPHGDGWWLVTRKGDVWRSRDGRAERLVAGLEDENNELFGASRLDVRPFGEALLVTHGSSTVQRWDGAALRPLSLPTARDPVGSDALCWSAVSGPGEVWLAGPERLLVGDGVQWHEFPRLDETFTFFGLCASPGSSGAWLTGNARLETGLQGFVVRATLTHGYERFPLEPADLTAGRLDDSTSLRSLFQPGWHCGGLRALNSEGLLTWRPRLHGLSVSLRSFVDDDGFGPATIALSSGHAPVDGFERACEAVEALVRQFDGWFES